MKKSMNYSKALEIINALSQSEKDSLVQEIMSKLHVMERHEEDFCFEGSRCDKIIADVNPGKPDCPHCAAKASLGYIVRNGNHKGAQRYKCKACGKKFVSTTNTAFSRTRKSAETWRKFIEMTISQKSIAECAAECDLCIQTAFNWRHKVLNAFAVNQDAVKMCGNVEVDEMLLPISYKGNHIQGSFGSRKDRLGSFNDIPRKAYRRGTDNKSMSAKEKTCVFCMVENGNKAFYAAVPGVGFMNEAMLDATVAKHVDKDKAMMLADNYKVTRNYFVTKGYNHTILSSNTSDNPHDHKPEIKNGLHMQHVNTMHRHIRRFLSGYCGVSSKYLENYIALYVWLKTVGASRQRKTADKVSAARAATPDCYITGKAIYSRPAVPMCA